MSENKSFETLIVDETKIHTKISFDVEKIAYRNSVILLASALDTFLKDAFIEILVNIFLQKIPTGLTPEKVARRYSFQNYYEIKNAFEWLDSSFNKDLVRGEGRADASRNFAI